MSTALGIINGFHATANALATVICAHTLLPAAAENFAPLIGPVSLSFWFAIAILLIAWRVWIELVRAALLLMTAECP